MTINIKVKLANADGQEIVEFTAADVLAYNNVVRAWEGLSNDPSHQHLTKTLVEDFALFNFKRRYGDVSDYRVEVLEGLTGESESIAETTQTVQLVPASFSGGVKSISDDDLCANCQHCQYRPGAMSGCDVSWPGLEDEDGYVQECTSYGRVAEDQHSAPCADDKLLVYRDNAADMAKRNIFREAMQARYVSTSLTEPEPAVIRRCLVAQKVLGDLPSPMVISAEAYDADPVFASCFGALDQGFEFPDWRGRTVREFHFMKATLPTLRQANVIQIKGISGKNISPAFVTFGDMLDAIPNGNTGDGATTWCLPSGNEITFHTTLES